MSMRPIRPPVAEGDISASETGERFGALGCSRRHGRQQALELAVFLPLENPGITTMNPQ